jgi:hypothetical protein
MNQIVSLIREKPERADWWIAVENSSDSSEKTYGDGNRFRKDRPSYQELKRFALSHNDLFESDEQTIPCFCGD